MSHSRRERAITTEAHTPSEERRRRGRGPLAVLGGIGTAVVVVVLLVVPVIVRLRLPPEDFPTQLPDGTGIALYGLAGILIGLLVQVGRSRPIMSSIAAIVLGVLAVWFSSETWWFAPWLPSPPLLPDVPAGVAVLTGVFVAATVVAAGGRAAGPAGPAHAAQPSSWPGVVLGIVAAVAVILVTEGDVWGRRSLQQTFEGPWGLSRPSWLALLFGALILVGALVGWAATSVRRRRPAALVALVLLAAWVGVVTVIDGLGGPPRTTRYGLVFGVLLLAAVASIGRRASRRRARPDRNADADADQDDTPSPPA